MGLKYLYKEGEKSCTKEPLKVQLDVTLVGEIRKVKDGFQYFPKGQKSGGDIFSNVAEVQRSLARNQKPKKSKADKKVDENKSNEALAEDLRKAHKKIGKQEADIERAEILLNAVVDLFDIQVKSKTPVNLLKESVNYNDTDCDGHSLVEDIETLLG